MLRQRNLCSGMTSLTALSSTLHLMDTDKFVRQCLVTEMGNELILNLTTVIVGERGGETMVMTETETEIEKESNLL